MSFPFWSAAWALFDFGAEGFLFCVFFEGAIQIPTVSRSPEDLNTTAMAEFGSYIQKGTELSDLAIFAALFHFHK